MTIAELGSGGEEETDPKNQTLRGLAWSLA